MPPVMPLARRSLDRPSIRTSNLLAELGSHNAAELEAENEALQVRIAGLESEVVDLQEEVDRLSKTRSGQLENTNSKLQTKVGSLEFEVADLHEEVERLTAQLASKS